MLVLKYVYYDWLQEKDYYQVIQNINAAYCITLFSLIIFMAV